MNHCLTTICTLGAAGLLLGGCNESVYYPLQPTVPLVTGTGQTEISASLDQNGFGVARASVVPVSHLLLTGSASGRFWGSRQFRENLPSQRRQQQWEVGIGSFRRLWPHTTGGLLGGYGQGHSNYQERVHDISFSMGGGGVSTEYQRYESRTNRWYAQLYLLADLLPDDPTWKFELGAAYRLSLVRYQRYTHQRYLYSAYEREPQAYDVPAALWHSIAATGTLRLKAWPALALQPSLGLALPLRANPRTGHVNDAYLTEVSHYGRWGQASIGLALYPHLLRQKAQ